MLTTFARTEIFGIALNDSCVANFSGTHGLTPRIIATTRLSSGQIGYGETPCSSQILETALAVARIPDGRLVSDIWSVMDDLQAAIARHIRTRGWDDVRGLQSFDNGIERHVVSLFEHSLACAASMKEGAPLHQFVGGTKQRDAVRFAGYGFFNHGAKWARARGLYVHPASGPADSWACFREKRAWDRDSIVAQFLKMHAEFGCKTYKLKGGVLDPWTEVEIMQALRGALGDSVSLVYDPNTALGTVELALEILIALEGSTTYVEDPVADLKNMALVQQALFGRPKEMCLATNMCAPDMQSHIFAKLLGSFGITLSGDVHYFGGIRKALELAIWCVKNGILFGSHSNYGSSITTAQTVQMGAACVQHDVDFDTHSIWNVGDHTRDVVRETLVPRDGVIQVPNAPGLGIEVDEALLEAARQRFIATGRMDRADHLWAQVLIPGWKPPQTRTAREGLWYEAGAPGYKMPERYLAQ